MDFGSDAEPTLPAIPRATGVDHVRDVVDAIANLDPTGIASTVLDLFNFALPRALERRRKQFYEELVKSIAALQFDSSRLSEQVATAAIAQGTLAAARSASDEHLHYLANATAHAATVTGDDATVDHAFLILRLVGDLSATHVRMLQMLADPHRYAAALGLDFEWRTRGGRYEVRQVIDDLGGVLAGDRPLADAIYRDLDRLGLVGDDDPMQTVIDGGGASDRPPEPLITHMARELLNFVADSVPDTGVDTVPPERDH